LPAMRKVLSGFSHAEMVMLYHDSTQDVKI
jgi:hypothetical protein